MAATSQNAIYRGWRVGRPSENEKIARAEWLAAMAEFNELAAELPSGLPCSDGQLRIKQARTKLSTAYARYRDSVEGL